MPDFTWEGHRLHFREAGAAGAPLLIILPGSTASSASHGGELEYFGRTHRVAALDYLGTGASGRFTPWPLDWWERGAVQAAALAAQLGAGCFALLGCSGGGVAALLAAADHPDRVTAVVADSCPERLSSEELRGIAAGRVKAPATPQGPSDAAGAAPPPPGAGVSEQPFPGSIVEMLWREGPRLLRKLVAPSGRAFWQRAHGDDWAEVVAADTALLLELADRGGWDPLAGRLGDVRCPVLLTSSLGDEELPSVVAQHQHLAMELTDCRLWVTPRGGHPAMWTDRRGFRREAARFLAGV
jgi:pimeloyl-ACP methyl ester carboxylesterase